MEDAVGGAARLHGDAEKVAHPVLGDELFGGAVGNQAAVLHQKRAREGRLDVFHLMGDEQDAAARRGHLRERLAHVPHAFGVEPGAGLVEDDDLRAVHQGAREEHAARLAGGQGVDLALGQLDAPQLLHAVEGNLALAFGDREAGRHAQAAEEAAQHDVDRRQMHGDLVLHARGHHADHAAHLGGDRAGVAAEEHGRLVAVEGHHLAREQFHERRLARPVWPQDRNRLAVVDRQIVDGENVAAVAAHHRILQPQQGHGRVGERSREGRADFVAHGSSSRNRLPITHRPPRGSAPSRGRARLPRARARCRRCSKVP